MREGAARAARARVRVGARGCHVVGAHQLVLNEPVAFSGLQDGPTVEGAHLRHRTPDRKGPERDRKVTGKGPGDPGRRRGVGSEEGGRAREGEGKCMQNHGKDLQSAHACCERALSEWE